MSVTVLPPLRRKSVQRRATSERGSRSVSRPLSVSPRPRREPCARPCRCAGSPGATSMSSWPSLPRIPKLIRYSACSSRVSGVAAGAGGGGGGGGGDSRERAQRAGLPDIQLAALDAGHLEILARASGARRGVEIGTLGGYSGLALLRGMGPQGRLDTFEIDPDHARLAEDTFRRAGVW